MVFSYEKGKDMSISTLYQRKANRVGRIEMIKGEIRTIDRLITEKEKELK